MQTVIYESNAANFGPLVRARTVGQLRCGRHRLIDRVERLAGGTMPVFCRPEIAEWVTLMTGRSCNEATTGPTLALDASCLWGTLPESDGPFAGYVGERLVCVRTHDGLSPDADVLDVAASLPRREVEARVFEWPWELVLANASQLAEDWRPADVGDTTGRSLLPVVRGEDLGRDAVFFSHQTHEANNHWPYRAVRTRTHKLTLHLRPETPLPLATDLFDSASYRGLRGTPAADALRRRPAEVLTDVRAAPHERVNLIDDPAHASVRNELRARLLAFRLTTNDLWLEEDYQAERIPPNTPAARAWLQDRARQSGATSNVASE